MWRGPRALRSGRIWCFHSVSWWMVLQRHFGVGPRRTVAFSVRCGLPFLVPYQRGAMISSDDFRSMSLWEVQCLSPTRDVSSLGCGVVVWCGV